MSTTKNFAFPEGADFNAFIESAKQNLTSQGYEVMAQVLSETTATMTVSKDNDGIKKLIGLGVEATVSLTITNGTTLTANIEDSWTNKILAIAIGWFACLVPFITGIIGCSNQSSLKNKISNAIMMASSSAK